MNLAEQLLTAAGLEKNRTFKEVRFLKVPKTTFAVWLDSQEADGADYEDFYIRHYYTIELYAYDTDRSIEGALEIAMQACGIKYDKSEKMWLPDEQFYMTRYAFEDVRKL